jgi:hypothetical protein
VFAESSKIECCLSDPTCFICLDHILYPVIQFCVFDRTTTNFSYEDPFRRLAMNKVGNDYDKWCLLGVLETRALASHIGPR